VNEGAAGASETRKVVTVFFTDVADSTALGERLDPELLRRVMWRYFDVVQGVLERHGGTVEKFIGDAVMAVFGVPVVREDDALRAVRAAVELGEALRGLDDVVSAYADRYAAFRADFCELDDGHAAARVVDRVFAS
jgi:class 3 adenylate cyclase